MHYIGFLFVLITVMIFVLATFLLCRKFKTIGTGIAITLLVCITIMMFCMYLFNGTVHETIDMNFFPIKQHRYTMSNNDTNYIILPPNTALKYRSSGSSALYKSKTNIDKVIELYSSLAIEDSFTIHHNENMFEISFIYQNEMILLKCEPINGHTKFNIDVIKDNV